MTQFASELEWGTTLHRLLATAMAIGKIRIELLGLELESEKRRLVDALLWAGVALLLLGLAGVMLCGFVLLLVWDGHRLWATAGTALLLLGLGLAAILYARRCLRSSLTRFVQSKHF